MNDIRKIFILIYNHNAGDGLVKLISKIHAQSLFTPEIIVLDNSSTDGSLEKAKQKFPLCRFIVNFPLGSWAKCANAGARYALEKFAQKIIFLDSHLAIDDEALAKIINESDGCDILALPVFFEKELVSLGNIDFSNKTLYFSDKDSGAIFFAPSHGMVVSNRVFAKIGIFDERFLFCWSDADFCLRANKERFSLKKLSSPIGTTTKFPLFDEQGAHHDSELFFQKNSSWLQKKNYALKKALKHLG